MDVSPAAQSARQPRVISASKRTDIPAFYLPWLARQVEQGWVDVPNPMFRHARDPSKFAIRVSLRPDDVAAIVWWSKNYGVYLRARFLDIFSRYDIQYFHFTINSRRDDLAWLEPDVPAEATVIAQVEKLAQLRNPDMIAWRYDPICFWLDRGQRRSSWDPGFFERTSRTLASLGVRSCYTSLADPYQKFVLRLRAYFPHVELRGPEAEELHELGREMAHIAQAYG
ncbi:MAG: DUF1848 family protein, partial [Chloroflexia bacterium]|nr:DUF1848 family protein [Chloroflexia bacterium]